MNVIELRLLIDIMNIDFLNHKNLNITDLSKLLNIAVADKNFQSVKNLLKEENILIIQHKNTKNHIILDVNKKKLKELIPEISIVRKIHDDFIEHWEGKTLWLYDD